MFILFGLDAAERCKISSLRPDGLYDLIPSIYLTSFTSVALLYLSSSQFGNTNRSAADASSGFQTPLVSLDGLRFRAQRHGILHEEGTQCLIQSDLLDDSVCVCGGRERGRMRGGGRGVGGAKKEDEGGRKEGERARGERARVGGESGRGEERAREKDK